MVAFVVFLLVGVVAATFGSLIGLGGGVIMIPALIYLSPILLDIPLSTAEAVGTSLMVLIFTALSSTFTFHRQKRIDYRSGLLFFATSGPGAILGAMLTGYFAAEWFQLVFGVFMLLMSFMIWLKGRLKSWNKSWKIEKTYIDTQGVTHHYGYSLLPALTLGFAVGIVSGLFGIGGGSLFVPVLILLFRYPPHVATATSMFVILLSSIPGTAVKWSLAEIHLMSVLALIPGALLGGWLGAYIAGRLSSPRLQKVLLIAFLLIALSMIWQGSMMLAN